MLLLLPLSSLSEQFSPRHARLDVVVRASKRNYLDTITISEHEANEEELLVPAELIDERACETVGKFGTAAASFRREITNERTFSCSDRYLDSYPHA